MKLMNTPEAAEALGVSVWRVRQLIAEGKLAARDLGRDYVIEINAVEWIQVYGKPGRSPKEATDSKKDEKSKRRG